MKKIKVGIVGFGTIGSGVARVLAARKGLLRQKSGIDITLARICEKDLARRKGAGVDKKLFTPSIAKILYDPEIDIVVELIGGIHPAKDIICEALRQGKHVVTANKALLSAAGNEIFALANTLGLSVGFEASVGGGIPIIRALNEGFIANNIERIYGIINGTTNFILSNMAEHGSSFAEALALAQKYGYAERNPSLDIDGIDSQHKLAILALLGFGVSPAAGAIYTEGIAGLDASDIAYARELGYAIKLLAIAKRAESALELRVHPTLIPKSHLLANVNDVYNAIVVKGDLIGENLFFGAGAGAAPTSSAVVSDIIAIARDACAAVPALESVPRRAIPAVKAIDEIRTRYYLRFSAIDKPGVLATVSGILGKHKISIASVTQKARKTAKVVPIVMMTHEACERDMTRALAAINRLSAIKKETVRLRVED